MWQPVRASNMTYNMSGWSPSDQAARNSLQSVSPAQGLREHRVCQPRLGLIVSRTSTQSSE
eukprot:2927296-Prymnesium_polylepis.1